MSEPVELNIDHLVTEDDTPVDNLPSAKNQRGMINPLYDSDYLPRPFLADCNVGIFISRYRPAIVPDMFISLGVEIAEDWWAKEHRSYYFWEFGKPPDVVVEIVSNKTGGETTTKVVDYAEMGIKYYVIYDPQLLLLEQELVVYELYAGRYQLRPDYRLPNIGLSLMLWEGVFEGKHDTWLRWCDMFGTLLLSGAEQAEEERKRTQQARAQAEEAQNQAEEAQNQAAQARTQAEEAQNQAEQERIRAEQAETEAKLFAAKLRELGIDPGALR